MKKHLLTNSYNRGITNLKSNAFTLIELLAIIVILAIIAVITVPIILNIIENSKKGAASDSAYGYKDSVNKFYISELQNHNKLKLDGKYTVNSNGSLTPAEDNTFGFGDSEYGNTLNVQVSGTIPSSGKLRYSNNVLDGGCLVIDEYKITFKSDGSVDQTVKGNCSDYVFPSENSGSSSGTSPVVSTWNIYYYSEDGLIFETSTFDSSWEGYVRKDTINDIYELCNTSEECFPPLAGPIDDPGYLDNASTIWLNDNGSLTYGDDHILLCTDGRMFQSYDEKCDTDEEPVYYPGT